MKKCARRYWLGSSVSSPSFLLFSAIIARLKQENDNGNIPPTRVGIGIHASRPYVARKRTAGKLGQVEIHNLDLAFGRDHDIRTFHVTMNDALFRVPLAGLPQFAARAQQYWSLKLLTAHCLSQRFPILDNAKWFCRSSPVPKLFSWAKATTAEDKKSIQKNIDEFRKMQVS